MIWTAISNMATDRDTADINPYSPGSQESLMHRDPKLYAAAVSLAKTRARGGSATNSISIKVQQLGIEPRLAERIATEAVAARARIEKIQGLALCLGGLAATLIGLAIFVTVRQWNGRLPFITPPLVIAVFGAFLVMLGVAKLFARRPG